MTGPAPAKKRFGPILGLAGGAIVLAAAPMVAYRYWEQPLVIAGLACFYVIIAIVLRSRFVMGALVGMFLGLLFDSGVKSELPDARVWRKAGQVVAGLIIGLAAGVAWEHGTTGPELRGEGKPKRRDATAKRR